MDEDAVDIESVIGLEELKANNSQSEKDDSDSLGIHLNDLRDGDLEQRIQACEKLVEEIDSKLMSLYEETISPNKLVRNKDNVVALYDSLLFLPSEELVQIAEKVKYIEQELIELNGLDPDASATKFLGVDISNESPVTIDVPTNRTRSSSRGIRLNVRLRAKMSLTKVSPLRKTVDEVLSWRESNEKPLKVFTATWNVGNRAPTLADLQHILPCNSKSVRPIYPEGLEGNCEKTVVKTPLTGPILSPRSHLKSSLSSVHTPRQDYDIVVFGLQECDYNLTDEMKKNATIEQQAKRDDKALYEKIHCLDGEDKKSYKKKVKNAIMKAIPGVYSEKPPAPKNSMNDDSFVDGYNKTRLKVENTLKTKVLTSLAGMHVLSMVRSVLGPHYALVRVCELTQMRLFVMVRKVHLHAIKHVTYSSEATGVAHIGTNKGGVGVSFSIYGLKLAWISCHLAAHKKHVRARGDNLQEIFENFDKKFGRKGFNMASEYDHVFVLGDLNYRLDLSYNKQYAVATKSGSESGDCGDDDGIHTEYIEDDDDCSSDSEIEFIDHDIDDLIDMVISESEEMRKAAIQSRRNSKISSSRTRESSNRSINSPSKSPSMRGVNTGHSSQRPHAIQLRQTEHPKADATMHEWNLVARLVEEKGWDEVKEIDQLYNERKAGTALFEFEEGVYDFLPTFKVQRNVKETKFVEKRTPSYTDRILWYSSPGRKSAIKQLHLSSVPEAITSDHKPVTTSFEIHKSVLREEVIDAADITPTEYVRTKPMDELDTEKNVLKHLSPQKAEPIQGASLYEIGKNFLKRKLTEHRSSMKEKQALRMQKNQSKCKGRSQTPFRINITKLEASSLHAADLGGSSDPYCVICSPNLFDSGSDGANPYKGIARTKTLSKTLNPIWNDFAVSFKCDKSISSVHYLSGRYIVFALWDEDHNKADKLGQALLNLQPLVDSYIIEAAKQAKKKTGMRKEDVENSLSSMTEVERIELGTIDNVCSKIMSFTLPVILKGCKHGELKGEVEIAGERTLKHLHHKYATVTGSEAHEGPCLTCSIF